MRNFDTISLDAASPIDQPNGFMSMMANLTRTGVFTYFERTPDGTIRVIRQFRDPEEVFAEATIQSLMGLPITNNHPTELVSPENARAFVVGMTSDTPKKVYLPEQMPMDQAEAYVQQQITLFDANAISQVKTKKKTQLSLGYVCALDESPGVYKGQPYDFVQRDIRYNHLSLVDQARGGPECKVLIDSIEYVCDGTSQDDNNQQEQKNMKIVNWKGKKVEVTDDAADLFASMEAYLADGETTSATLKAQLDTLKAQLDSATEKLNAKKEEDNKDAFRKAVSVRVSLEGKARRILKDEAASIEAMDDVTLMKAVIAKASPKLDIKDKSDAYIQARFDCIMEDFKEAVGRSADEQKIGETLNSDSNNDSWETAADKARDTQWNRDRDAWKAKKA
jgi:hypothetical protein